MTTKILTQSKLKELFNYNPITGIFTNKVARNARAKINDTAGALNSNGYIVFQVNKTKIYAHRAAWMYTHGFWPNAEIDHINRVRNDNRLVNLRLANRLENSHNTGKHAKSISGHKGVAWHSRNKKWQVQMRVRGTHYYIGQFSELQDAVNARLQAEKKLYANDNIFI